MCSSVPLIGLMIKWAQQTTSMTAVLLLLQLLSRVDQSGVTQSGLTVTMEFLALRRMHHPVWQDVWPLILGIQRCTTAAAKAQTDRHDKLRCLTSAALSTS